MVLDANGLPEILVSTTLDEFSEALKCVFGDDEAVMSALGRNDLHEITDRLWPYAHGFASGGTLLNCEYKAPAITLERIQHALDDPNGLAAITLAIDVRKYQSAERLLHWIQEYDKMVTRRRYTTQLLSKWVLNA